jgi:hypothetical protein
MKSIKYYLFLLICLLTTINVYAEETNTETTQDSSLSMGMLIFIVTIIFAGTLGLIMHLKNKAQREEDNKTVKRMKENLRNSVENGINGPYANNMNNNYYNNNNNQNR